MFSLRILFDPTGALAAPGKACAGEKLAGIALNKRLAWLAAAGLTLAACAPDGLSPADRAELDNMLRVNLVPKSTATEMVTAFDDFCVASPRAQTEQALRGAGYIPLPDRAEGARAFAVDDRRPVVAFSDRMCVVRAKARSGQTDRFAAYVAETFPDAQPADPARFGDDIEAAWLVPGPSVVATERRRDIDFFVFTLIHYAPEGS
ncbi:MAG: hypothetical protein AAF636_11015 [Pseudomonadota bacterium]